MNADGNPSSYTSETETITLQSPSREYFDFGGWYTDGEFSDSSKKMEITKGSSGNITLYAKWILPVANAPALAETLEPGEYRIAMSGPVTNKDNWPAELKDMVDILKNKPDVKVYLDLKDVELFAFSDGSIYLNVFNQCENLTGIVISDCSNTIERSAFSGCTSLREVIIPENVKSIEDNAFSSCTSLERIVLPKTLTSIGSAAFDRCTNLKNIELPDGITAIGERTFNDCRSLESIAIPKNVTSINSYLFRECTSLKTVEIHENVESLGDGVFSGCTSLRTLTIPASITYIGNYIFDRCCDFTINYGGTKEQWDALIKDVDIALSSYNTTVNCTGE